MVCREGACISLKYEKGEHDSAAYAVQSVQAHRHRAPPGPALAVGTTHMRCMRSVAFRISYEPAMEPAMHTATGGAQRRQQLDPPRRDPQVLANACATGFYASPLRLLLRERESDWLLPIAPGAPRFFSIAQDAPVLAPPSAAWTGIWICASTGSASDSISDSTSSRACSPAPASARMAASAWGVSTGGKRHFSLPATRMASRRLEQYASRTACGKAASSASCSRSSSFSRVCLAAFVYAI